MRMHTISPGISRYSQCQQKKHKVCREQVFYDKTGQEENCGEMATLTYGQLAKYYIEFVVQLKLTEMIVNDSSLIAREVVEAERAEVLDIERIEHHQIIFLFYLALQHGYNTIQ